MLDLSKKLLIILSLVPLTKSPAKNAISMLRYFVKLLVEAVTATGSFLYLLENLSDINESTEAGYVCFAIGTSFFIYSWMISKRHYIQIAFNDLESYVNESILFFSTI